VRPEGQHTWMRGTLVRFSIPNVLGNASRGKSAWDRRVIIREIETICSRLGSLPAKAQLSGSTLGKVWVHD
jgi:hypothetical protein